MSLIRWRFQKDHSSPGGKITRGQSFLELALVLPILIIMILGLVEITVFMSRYLDLLDLTREAARFASVRDPFAPFSPSPNCSDPTSYDFYYSSSCVFAPPEGSSACSSDTAFCGGLNPYIIINSATDDVLISVFTVTRDGRVTAVHPTSAPWALSDHDSDTIHNGNWKRNCEGTIVRTEPYYTAARVQNELATANSLPNRGFVAVEAFYCHALVLGIPTINDYLTNPIQIHAYTIMSLPAGQPTPTPSY